MKKLDEILEKTIKDKNVEIKNLIADSLIERVCACLYDHTSNEIYEICEKLSERIEIKIKEDS